MSPKTRRIASARGDLASVLRRHGYDPRPSDAPRLLVPQAAGLRTALAERAVVVRDCASFGLAGTVRIAVPTPAGLARLDAALGTAR